MEGFAATGSVIAVVQIAAEVTKLCAHYIRDVQHAREDIQRMQSKVSAVHDVLQKIDNLPGEHNDPAIKQCCNDPASIQRRLELSKKHKAMKRVGIRALRWFLTSYRK